MRSVLSALSLILLTYTTYVQAQDTASGPVQFKRNALNFGAQLESTCTSRKVQVTNVSDTAISDPEFKTEDSRTFPIQPRFKKCPNPLKPGETCRIYVNFCPLFERNYRTKLYFKDSGVYLPLSGRGVGNKF